jgi:hypothetical protein
MGNLGAGIRRSASALIIDCLAGPALFPHHTTCSRSIHNARGQLSYQAGGGPNEGGLRKFRVALCEARWQASMPCADRPGMRRGTPMKNNRQSSQRQERQLHDIEYLDSLAQPKRLHRIIQHIKAEGAGRGDGLGPRIEGLPHPGVAQVTSAA